MHFLGILVIQIPANALAQPAGVSCPKHLCMDVVDLLSDKCRTGSAPLALDFARSLLTSIIRWGAAGWNSACVAGVAEAIRVQCGTLQLAHPLARLEASVAVQANQDISGFALVGQRSITCTSLSSHMISSSSRCLVFPACGPW